MPGTNDRQSTDDRQSADGGRRTTGLSALKELLRADVSAVLGRPVASALPAGRSLAEPGFNSLTAVQIRNRPSTAPGTGYRLSAAPVFERRTTGDWPALRTAGGPTPRSAGARRTPRLSCRRRSPRARGRSSDGNVTHLVTHHLEGTARAPVGLVLLDACPITPDGRGEDWLLCPAAPPAAGAGPPSRSRRRRCSTGRRTLRPPCPPPRRAGRLDGCDWRASWP
ncbi:acyl carrier protein [Streptomyces sp. NRRL S-475]|uniref:acyl carrier protein n=1 Tax=Streptomyces sp. NRRL S-475 TaxID=1463910 RepID=UPI00131E1647|nr:acyl carrier protein [Streptomyces sp. NRRL S-475]